MENKQLKDTKKMIYAVKTLYPEFKCLTAFRKVMKRVENFHKTIFKVKKGTGRNSGDWGEIPTRLATIIDMEWRIFNPIFQDEKVRMIKEMDVKAREMGTDFGERMENIRKFHINFTKVKWMWVEQNKYEM